MTVGQNIKKYRKKRGLTQRELADILETTQQNLAQYENDKRNPKIETIDRIAAALDLPIALLKEDIKWNEYTKTEEYKELSRESSAIESIKIILEYMYGKFEEKYIDELSYFLVGKGKDAFIISHEDIQKLLQYSVASFPFLIDELKDTRSESTIKAEILEAMKKNKKDQDTLE